MATSDRVDWSLQLPTELTLAIFEHLDEQSLCRMATTCRAWQRLASQPSLWFEICRRTQSNLDPDRSLHWKEKFKKRVSYRRRFLIRQLARRYLFLALSSLACVSLGLYALKQMSVQHRHLTKYEIVDGRVDKIEIVEHQDSNEDSEREIRYQRILHYSYSDGSGVGWHSWNLWPFPSDSHDEYSTREEALDAAQEIGKVGDTIQVYVDWSEHPPYSYLLRTAVFEPHFFLIVSLIGLCIMALAEAMSYSVLHIDPDTTDLKTFVPVMGRYVYPILDNRIDNPKLRRQQGILLYTIAALFHVLGLPSVMYYVYYSEDSSFLWVFFLIAEPIALYTTYQGWKHLLDCRFQPLLFSDQRPYLLLGSSNMLHVVFQAEKRFFARNITLFSSLTRVDQEVVIIPGEPDRTKIMYTVLYEQEIVCRNCINQWIHPGQHYVDSVAVILQNHLQQSSALDQTTFPRYVWKLTVRVSSNGPIFSKQLVVLVKQESGINN